MTVCIAKLIMLYCFAQNVVYRIKFERERLAHWLSISEKRQSILLIIGEEIELLLVILFKE